MSSRRELVALLRELAEKAEQEEREDDYDELVRAIQDREMSVEKLRKAYTNELFGGLCNKALDDEREGVYFEILDVLIFQEEYTMAELQEAYKEARKKYYRSKTENLYTFGGPLNEVTKAYLMERQKL